MIHFILFCFIFSSLCPMQEDRSKLIFFSTNKKSLKKSRSLDIMCTSKGCHNSLTKINEVREQNVNKEKKTCSTKGTLDIYCGPMFSGKSSEILRLIHEAQTENKNIIVFKHSFDNRYGEQYLVSHKKEKFPCISENQSSQIEKHINGNIDVVFIDELQFFDYGIVPILIDLRDKGMKIFGAGLDIDFKGIPFGPMPYLLAVADNVTKLRAICAKTGHPAQYSQRLVNGKPASHTDPIILIGASDCYEPRSRDSFKIDYLPIKEYLEKKL